MEYDNVICSQAYQNTSEGVEVFIKKEPRLLKDLDSDDYKDSSKGVEVTKECSALGTMATIIKDECVQHKRIGSQDYEYTQSGIEVFIKEEPFTPEDLCSEEYEDSSKAVELTPSITKELSDDRSTAAITKEECLEDAPYNVRFLGHIGEHYESMNAATHQLIIKSPGNKSQEEFILPDIINNIHAIEETFKKEPASYEKIYSAPKETSLEVSRRALRPRMHKDYKLRESNCEASSSQEYTLEDIASKQPTSHESTLVQSVLYESLSKQTTTHEFALPEFVIHDSLPRESLTHQSVHGHFKPQESEEESMAEVSDDERHTSEDSDTDEWNDEYVKSHTTREMGKRRMEGSVLEVEHPSKKMCKGNNEEEKMYSCNICRKTFLSHANISQHLKYVHSDKKPFQCEICGKSFKRKFGLEIHSKIHSEAKPFNCKLCSKSFNLKQTLLRHELVHNRRSSYNCIHCDKGFSRKVDFAKHQPMHDGEKVWECDECAESFKQWKDVVEHREAHRRKKGLTCDMCGIKFRMKWQMRKHMLTHTLPHQCNICGKNFSTTFKLSIHMRSHTGERPFPCTLCEKHFRIKYRLVEHMHIHMGVKPYACKKCDQTFTQRRYLNRHLKRKHLH